MERLSREEWIAIASHRLARRWRHVDLEQLDAVAAELYLDARLRTLAPEVAAASWLAPLDAPPARLRA